MFKSVCKVLAGVVIGVGIAVVVNELLEDQTDWNEAWKDSSGETVSF